MKVNSLITAILLAGGKSSRMNSDKAFLKLSSKTVIEELISRLERKFAKIIIIANEVNKYMKFGTEVVSDILPGRGPLGGIYTGLIRSEDFYNFVFACDMPFVNLDLIDYMVSRVSHADIIVPRFRGKFEPLWAIYSKNCIPPIEIQLKKSDLKITNFFSQVKVKIIEQEEIERFTARQPLFLNINTSDDYHSALELLQ